jgi:hypothetical protein
VSAPFNSWKWAAIIAVNTKQNESKGNIHSVAHLAGVELQAIFRLTILCHIWPYRKAPNQNTSLFKIPGQNKSQQLLNVLHARWKEGGRGNKAERMGLREREEDSESWHQMRVNCLSHNAWLKF